MVQEREKDNKKDFKICGTLKVEEHPEVSRVYRREERQIYYNSVAKPDSNVILLR